MYSPTRAIWACDARGTTMNSQSNRRVKGTGSGTRKCWRASELLETRRHGLVLVCFARLALAPYAIVLADAPPSALLAPALLLIVLAVPRLPPSRTIHPLAAPPLVSVWRRPLTPALS